MCCSTRVWTEFQCKLLAGLEERPPGYVADSECCPRMSPSSVVSISNKEQFFPLYITSPVIMKSFGIHCDSTNH